MEIMTQRVIPCVYMHIKEMKVMGEFFSKHFTLERVSRNVFAAVAKEGGGSVANAGFVDLGGNVLVFDTFNTQQAAEDLKRMAENITNQPVTWVINSHWHGDHVRGNQVYKGSNIISSDITYSIMKEKHPSRIVEQKNDRKGLSTYIESLINKQDNGLDKQINFLRELEKSLPGLELVLPNQTFHGQLTFWGEKCSAKLFSPGGGHSFCDAILHIPEEKVIFMGDLLFVQCHPTFFEESDLDNWVEIMEQVKKMDNVSIAIPGHGQVGTKRDLSKLVDYINGISKKVREIDSIAETEMPASYRDWQSPEIYRQNVKMAHALLND